MSTIEQRADKHGGYNGAGTCAVCGCPVMDSILTMFVMSGTGTASLTRTKP